LGSLSFLGPRLFPLLDLVCLFLGTAIYAIITHPASIVNPN